jgi:hypothetical protein
LIYSRRRFSCRAICSSVVVRDRRRRGEVAPAEFYCSLENSVPERVALAVSGFPQRRDFPGEQTVWFLLWRYSKYAEHLRNPDFCSSSILFTQSTTWVFCSAGNPPPRGNPGQKHTQTDNILKKITFKMQNKRQSGSYKLQSYPITPSTAFANLVRLYPFKYRYAMLGVYICGC